MLMVAMAEATFIEAATAPTVMSDAPVDIKAAVVSAEHVGAATDADLP